MMAMVGKQGGRRAWMIWRNGQTEIIADEPEACPSCRRMTVFFVNRDGCSQCTDCAEQGVARW